MKRSLILGASVLLLLSSCDTYTGAGAYMGTYIGGILGSAIGGISDGPRGSDIGTIVGMAGGAVLGGVVGTVADQHQANAGCSNDEAPVRHRSRVSRSDNNSQQSYQQQSTDDSGFRQDNSGDDRIYDFNSSDYTGNYSAQQPTATMPATQTTDNGTSFHYLPTIEIRNARFVDANEDKVISRGELCKVIFEVMNNGEQAVTDVVPVVTETTGNRHIFISPSMHIERIEPGKGIRYTALVKADKRLKDGEATFTVRVIQGGSAVSKVMQFTIPTRKK